MTKTEIEDRIKELKMDYIRIQNDLDKLESVGGNVTNAEKQLKQLETELSELNKALAKTSK
ncbi:SE1832 family protein [Aquibacillus sp. 3ASR75-11]|uniref:SE1832 family protein n=1 Tax=Terrihalobacillus insolitus TaxID=2950438 RepID=A0A9X3WUC5_9BACI|nr:SE1832 family protein [Terrihalobacillus insolitus]MDC3414579.1 SE1832 family protein [Terrihalobacillus insolitus]MDC3425745.1 SE1832 family protein [Terrihalobacillus insolitus]